MKKIVTLLIVATIFTSSCTRDITAKFNNTINNSTTVTGTFILTKYGDSASEFSGYVFSFNVDGKITVEKNNQTSLATYTETYSYDGNPERLGLFFYNKPLSYLNNNWQIDLISDAAIHLADASTGNVLEFAAQ